MTVTYRYATPWLVSAALIVAGSVVGSVKAEAPAGDAPQPAATDGWQPNKTATKWTVHLPLSAQQRVMSVDATETRPHVGSDPRDVEQNL